MALSSGHPAHCKGKDMFKQKNFKLQNVEWAKLNKRIFHCATLLYNIMLASTRGNECC